MILTINCLKCRKSITVRDLKFTAAGIGYKLDNILKQNNYYRYDGGFLCSACNDKQVKKSA